MQAFRVEVGFQVYLKEGGEEIGAVREVAHDHVIVYVEGAGDFMVKGGSVLAAHDGKLVLDPTKVSRELLAAASRAHETESE